MSATTYGNIGVTTIRGAYGMLVFWALVGLIAAVFYGVRTHDRWNTTWAILWIVGTCWGTLRTLRQVAEAPPDDPMTQLAFRLAIGQPVAAIFPILFWMLP